MRRLARTLLLLTLALSPSASAVGRPTVKVDRLVMAADAQPYEKVVRAALARETRKADWGAGTGSVIEIRFSVDSLTVVSEGSVVRVGCAAHGELPRGKRARSKLTMSGAHAEQEKLVQHVLEIVVRGVVTRLSELERQRRRGHR